MPKIPRAQITQTVPGTTGQAIVNVSAQGQIGRALQGAGESVSGIGDVLAKRAETLKIQDRVNQSTIINSQYDDDQRVFKAGELNKKGSDAYDNVERGRQFRADMLQKYTKDIEDPVLKDATARYITARTDRMLDSLSSHQQGQRAAVTKQARDLTMDGLLKESFSGEPLSDTIGIWRETIANQQASGLISEEEAINEILIGESNIAEAHIDGLIGADPQAAVEAIKSGAYDEYLTQKQQEDFAKKGRQLASAMKKDAETRKKEQDRLNKIAMKEAQTKTGNEFLAKNLDGTLTRAEVMASNLDPTGENSKKAWLKEIESREKKVEKNNDEWKTNPSVMADFQTRITLDPASVTEAEIVSAQGQGLSTTDARGLINYRAKKLGKEEDPQKTQEARTSYARLRDAKTARIYSKNRKENSDIWADNVTLLSKWIDNHPDENPADFVDELLTPAKDSFINDILSFAGMSEPDETEEERMERLTAEAAGRTDFLTDTGEEGISTDDNTQEQRQAERQKVKVRVVRQPDGTTEAIFPNGTRRTVTIENGKVVF
jgi:hypothetical protein